MLKRYESIYNCSMKFDPKIHHRRSIRLKGYDYSQAGAYFVTIIEFRSDSDCRRKIVEQEAHAKLLEKKGCITCCIEQDSRNEKLAFYAVSSPKFCPGRE